MKKEIREIPIKSQDVFNKLSAVVEILQNELKESKKMFGERISDLWKENSELQNLIKKQDNDAKTQIMQYEGIYMLSNVIINS